MSNSLSADDDRKGLKRKCPSASSLNAQQDQTAQPSASLVDPCVHRDRCDDEDDSSSVEALLAVPIDFIFRESRPPAGAGHSLAARGTATQPPPPPSQHRRRTTLLSRSEASVLLRINQLAIELDVLRSVASEALDRTRLTCDLRNRIKCENCPWGRSGSAYLRPLLPLLDVHGYRVPREAVVHVASETGRVLSELGGCASALRQFAEQNWSVAEQLCDAFGYDEDAMSSTGTGLGREKRAVAEVEEAVSARIEGLMGMASLECDEGVEGMDNERLDAFDFGTDKDTGMFLPMRELCSQLLFGAGCELPKVENRAKRADAEHTSAYANQKKGGKGEEASGKSKGEKSFDADCASNEANHLARTDDPKTKPQGVSVLENSTKLPSAPQLEPDGCKQRESESGTGASAVEKSTGGL